MKTGYFDDLNREILQANLVRISDNFCKLKTFITFYENLNKVENFRNFFESGNKDLLLLTNSRANEFQRFHFSFVRF